MGPISVLIGLSSLTALAADSPLPGTSAEATTAATETTPVLYETTYAPPETTPTPATPVPTPATPAPIPATPAPGVAMPMPAAQAPALPAPVETGAVPLQPELPAAPGTPASSGLLPDANALPSPIDYGGQTGTFEAPAGAVESPSGGMSQTGQLPEVPTGFGARQTGFTNPFGAFELLDGLGGSLLRGFSFGASLMGTYSSNPTLGYGGPNQSSGGDFFATLGGNVGYHTTSSALNFGATYSGSYNQYFSQTELSGYNQSGGLSASYEGSAFSANLTVGLSGGDGANRYYQAVVTQYSLNYALSASYRMTPKTSLVANIGQSFTMASGSSYTDTSSLNLGTSAMYHYSDRTQFGPGIGYSSMSGASTGFRTTIGPTISVNYRVTGKISMNSRLGLDFVSYDQGADDTTWSGSIGLDYRASELWGMNFSMNRGGQANPTQANGTQENTNFSLNYYHRIRRATWTLGGNYELTSSGTSADPNGNGVDSNYFSFNTGLSMPVFSNRASARTFMSWTDNSGGYVNSGSSFQVGAGLNWSF